MAISLSLKKKTSKTARTLLSTLACAAALAGCGATAGKSAHTDDLNSQKGESGVTVFGTVDAGVGSVRSSR
ncbi:hypothetical protein [Acidovorax sp. NCPPB 4044]|uniref:hypothetical protein n=1 Tax=Acidovorax sp. NCPPB 4044 TaxID=2940490 RepID=UPI0023042EBD|nr:hypothetical protein [Acidovorax sp. NCPPB 4044]MDA8523531.1 hypothetical protein [Acidovorax sp. NCPPB 4044]